MAKFAFVVIAAVDACTVKIEEYSDNGCSSLKNSYTVACGGCDQSYIRYDCVGGKAKGTLYTGGGCSGSVTGATTYKPSTCYDIPAQGSKSPGYHFSCSGALVNQTSEVVQSEQSPTLNSLADTCSLYQIADGSCGQSDLNCDYVKYAKAAEKGLQDGTCADQGYTHQTGTQTKTYPIIGEIVITTYDQGANFAFESENMCHTLFRTCDGSPPSGGCCDGLVCHYYPQAKQDNKWCCKPEGEEAGLGDVPCSQYSYSVDV
jgi:hypothetical protein